jgi:hypothetical protein
MTREPDRYSTPQSFEVRFHATDQGIFARATYARGTGRNYRTYRVHNSYLGVREADLRGLSVLQVTAVLVSDLLRQFRQLEATAHAVSAAQAVASGAPLGATGGTVTQDPLPGL